MAVFITSIWTCREDRHTINFQEPKSVCACPFKEQGKNWGLQWLENLPKNVSFLKLRVRVVCGISWDEHRERKCLVQSKHLMHAGLIFIIIVIAFPLCHCTMPLYSLVLSLCTLKCTPTLHSPLALFHCTLPLHSPDALSFSASSLLLYLLSPSLPPLCLSASFPLVTLLPPMGSECISEVSFLL